MKDGFSIGCQIGKCMWWVGNECAVTKHLRQVSIEPPMEAEAARIADED